MKPSPKVPPKKNKKGKKDKKSKSKPSPKVPPKLDLKTTTTEKLANEVAVDAEIATTERSRDRVKILEPVEPEIKPKKSKSKSRSKSRDKLRETSKSKSRPSSNENEKTEKKSESGGLLSFIRNPFAKSKPESEPKPEVEPEVKPEPKPEIQEKVSKVQETVQKEKPIEKKTKKDKKKKKSKVEKVNENKNTDSTNLSNSDLQIKPQEITAVENATKKSDKKFGIFTKKPEPKEQKVEIPKMLEDSKARKREIESRLMNSFLEREEGSRMNYTTKTVQILPKAADLPNYKLDTTDGESEIEPASDRNSPLLKSTAGEGNVPSGVYNNISLMEMLTKGTPETDGEFEEGLYRQNKKPEVEAETTTEGEPESEKPRPKLLRNFKFPTEDLSGTGLTKYATKMLEESTEQWPVACSIDDDWLRRAGERGYLKNYSSVERGPTHIPFDYILMKNFRSYG